MGRRGGSRRPSVERGKRLRLEAELDFYNYIKDTLPHRNDQERVGIGTALAALFGHPHPQAPDAAPDPNGLNDLLQRFNAAGLGHVAQSWVGTGPTQPISPGDLHRAVGDENLQNMSRQSGISTAQL